MKITRRGSGSDHGAKSIEIDKPRFSWNEREKMVEIRQTGIKDFTSGSTHNYIFQVSLNEIKELVKIVGDKPANTCFEEISEIFSPCLREIIRIERCCIGEVGSLKDESEVKPSH
ncbi:hypothetical protein [Nitrosomonas sp. wSCUT-2]